MGKEKTKLSLKDKEREAFFLANKIINLHILYNKAKAMPAIEIKKRLMKDIKNRIEELIKSKGRVK